MRWTPGGLLQEDVWMNAKEYACLLGRLVANLHSLEFLVRAYLYQKRDQSHGLLTKRQSLDTMRPGDTVKLNALTDFRDLDALINRYNKLTKRDLTLRVDPDIVVTRNALAHGRVSSPDGPTRLSLVRFDKPKPGATTTTVAYSQGLTADWLTGEITRTRAQITKVHRAIIELRPMRKP
jgi:hypothetical protein